jgi:hypothetical protein
MGGGGTVVSFSKFCAKEEKIGNLIYIKIYAIIKNKTALVT